MAELVVGGFEDTDVAPVVDGSDAVGLPREFVPERLPLRQFERRWTTWLTWPPAAVLMTHVAVPKLEFQQRSRLNSVSMLIKVNVMIRLTPIFSISSSNSDGRAPSSVGAAGKPTYLATPARTDTSWL